MNFDALIRSEDWGGKRVFLFESHHFAMLPWARLGAECKEAPRLLTLDYHTDTMEAFRRRAFQNVGGYTPLADRLAEERGRLVRRIDRRDEASVLQAVSELHHDEHIDAAVRSGILDAAFVISYEDLGHIVSVEQALNNDDPPYTEVVVDGVRKRLVLPPIRAQEPFTYRMPADRIVILEKRTDYAWLPSRWDRRDRAYRHAAIDGAFLGERLATIRRICSTAGVPDLFERPFILDIDLDYFNTARAVRPRDPSVFLDLVRRSSVITVALERQCVQALRLPGERIDSQILEEQLRALVLIAMQAT